MDTIKEEETILAVKMPCPEPFRETLNADAPCVLASDFSAAQLANSQAALNYGQSDKLYLHTFVWQPRDKCCKITSAVLTVKMKANAGNAGNDKISITGPGGAVIQPYSGQIYNSAFVSVGTLATKTWTITGAALDKLNCAHTLSFIVQDDTSVLSATLALSGCCLGKMCC